MLNFNFNLLDMVLNINVYNENKNLEKTYQIKMDYSYIIEKSIYNENNNIEELYIYAYTMSDYGHECDNTPFDINTMTNKNILNVLKNLLIVKNDMERELLKSEFNNYYYVLIDSVNSEMKDSLTICETI